MVFGSLVGLRSPTARCLESLRRTHCGSLHARLRCCPAVSRLLPASTHDRLHGAPPELPLVHHKERAQPCCTTCMSAPPACNLRAFAARLHSGQRTYCISTGTGSLRLSVILFSPENFTSNATSETATPSEHEAITFRFDPSSCNDLTVHF